MQKWQSIYNRGLPTFWIYGLVSIDIQWRVTIGFVKKMALTCFDIAISNGKNHDFHDNALEIGYTTQFSDKNTYHLVSDVSHSRISPSYLHGN